MGSNGVWLCPSEKVLLKAHFWDIDLKFETQLVQIFGFDLSRPGFENMTN